MTKPEPLRGLRVAFGFLTSLPIPQPKDWQEDDTGRAAGWFPLVGATIGLICAVAGMGLRLVLPPLPAALCAVIVWILLTGGLHLDGVSDCMDAFPYAGSPQKRLEIMKDSRHGTFGVLGLLCVLLLKISLIESIRPGDGLLVLPLSCALARWGVLLMIRLPLAHAQGMAAGLKKSVPPHALWQGAILPLALVIAQGAAGWAMAAGACLSFLCVARLALRQINGVNGDVLGMTIELGEIGALLAFVIMRN